MSWAIVAVPKQDDYCWNISSEKIPHMTLLFLGNPGYSAEQEMSVLGFVEHAAKTMLEPFGIPVERRGTLGADSADVVFFNKEFDTSVSEFRGALLKNRLIQEAYISLSCFGAVRFFYPQPSQLPYPEKFYR